MEKDIEKFIRYLKEQKNYYKISAKKFLNFNHYPQQNGKDTEMNLSIRLLLFQRKYVMMKRVMIRKVKVQFQRMLPCY